MKKIQCFFFNFFFSDHWSHPICNWNSRSLQVSFSPFVVVYSLGYLLFHSFFFHNNIWDQLFILLLSCRDPRQRMLHEKQEKKLSTGLDSTAATHPLVSIPSKFTLQSTWNSLTAAILLNWIFFQLLNVFAIQSAHQMVQSLVSKRRWSSLPRRWATEFESIFEKFEPFYLPGWGKHPKRQGQDLQSSKGDWQCGIASRNDNVKTLKIET